MRTPRSHVTSPASDADRRTPALARPLHPLQTIGNQAVQRLLEARSAQPRIPAPEPVTGRDRTQLSTAADARTAHALARFGQPSAGRRLQRDFKSDFEGKASTPAAPNAPAAPGTVRVQTYAPQGGKATWVNAPYEIYSPGEIPKEFHDQIMESGNAFQWRSGGLQAELQRLENRGELTVGDMLKFSRKA